MTSLISAKVNAVVGTGEGGCGQGNGVANGCKRRCPRSLLFTWHGEQATSDTMGWRWRWTLAERTASKGALPKQARSVMDRQEVRVTEAGAAVDDVGRTTMRSWTQAEVRRARWTRRIMAGDRWITMDQSCSLILELKVG